MNTQNLGIVSPVAMGDWQENFQYQKLNIVRHNGSSYIAKSENSGIEPGVESGWSAYWMLLNTDVEGAQGPQGPAGEGVPTGGLAGQVLSKNSDTNYDTKWIPQSQIAAGSAVNDGSGRNIVDTYETKADANTKNANLQDQITNNSQNIEKNSQIGARNSKRIDGLEQRINPSPFITDDSVAYQKDVPQNAVGAVEIQKIGGMSYKSKNLFIPSKVNTTSIGITFSYFNGYVKMSGTKTSGLNTITVQTPNITLPAGTYTVSCKMVSGSITLANNFDGVYFGINKDTYSLRTTPGVSVIGAVGKRVITLTEPTEIISFDIAPGYIGEGTVFNDALFEFQFEDGDTATTYQDGYEGLRSAKVTEVKSVGANLFDPSPIGTKTFIGLTYTTENDYVKINGTKGSGENVHTMTAPNMIVPAGNYTVSLRMISGRISGLVEGDGVYFGINKNTYGLRTTPAVAKIGDIGARTFTFSEPTIISSFDIAPAYSSYGAVFNNAVFACQFERADALFEFSPYQEHTLAIPAEVQALDGYGQGNPDDTSEYNAIVWDENGNASYQQKGNITDGVWRTLATPGVTDISDLITSDNLLSIQGRGTLTFENEYGYAVPSTVEYITAEATA